jgi:uncharacterized membrane protein YgcG
MVSLMVSRSGEIASITYRSVAAIVVVGLVGETISNGIVHLLIVLLGRDEGLGAHASISSLKVEVCTASTGGSKTSPQEGVGRLSGVSLGGVSAAGGSAEALRREGEAGAADSRSDGGGA